MRLQQDHLNSRHLKYKPRHIESEGKRPDVYLMVSIFCLTPRSQWVKFTFKISETSFPRYCECFNYLQITCIRVHIQEVCVCATHQDVKRWHCSVTVAQLNCVCVFVVCRNHFFVFETLTNFNFNFSTNSLFQKPLLLPSRYIAASFTPRRRPPWDFLGWRVSCPSWLLSPRRPHTRPRSFQSRLYSQCLHRPPRATWHWPIHRVALQWGIIRKRLVCHTAVIRYTAVVLLLYCCWVRIREAVILTCAKHRGPARFVFDLHHWFVQAQQQTYHVRQSWCVLKNREKKKNKNTK